jgi:hypothetical protein
VIGLLLFTRLLVAQPDGEVLGAVLGDLLTYQGEDSPLVPADGSKPTSISFTTQAVTLKQTVDEVLYQHEEEPWAKLSPVLLRGAGEAAQHLVARIGSVHRFDGFAPGDERIRLEGERPIEAWPPGFSKNERVALVRLIIPWSVHQVYATYLLSREEGAWTVRFREFVYYP